jgi:DivIVA domain-containing protein
MPSTQATPPFGQAVAPTAASTSRPLACLVDGIHHRLAAYFNEGTPLKSGEVRHAVFTPVSGKRGYGMGPVDAFLDRALEVLIAAE